MNSICKLFLILSLYPHLVIADEGMETIIIPMELRQGIRECIPTLEKELQITFEKIEENYSSAIFLISHQEAEKGIALKIKEDWFKFSDALFFKLVGVDPLNKTCKIDVKVLVPAGQISFHYSQEIKLSLHQPFYLKERNLTLTLVSIDSKRNSASVSLQNQKKPDGNRLSESVEPGGFLFTSVFGRRGLQMESLEERSITLRWTQ